VGSAQRNINTYSMHMPEEMNFPRHLFSECACGDDRCRSLDLRGTKYSFYEKDWYRRDNVCSTNISFSKVFDSVPKDIRTELIFYLNIFT